jgi:arginine repressor
LHAEKIHSQEELLKRLGKEGVEVTQATLSRDLKFLGVSRVPDGAGEYLYTVDPPTEPATTSGARSWASSFLATSPS